MTKMTTLKKALLLLSMGGATFALWGMPYGAPNCVSNSDLVGFYQAIGGESIETFSVSTSNVLNKAWGTNFPPSDFDKIVITPINTFWTAMWDNWIADQFPLDPA